ncbi:Protein of unknown function [Gryllus bimaculatus]|nr:Protein of unknown function [Gryllus bimaculatus]
MPCAKRNKLGATKLVEPWMNATFIRSRALIGPRVVHFHASACNYRHGGYDVVFLVTSRCQSYRENEVVLAHALVCDGNCSSAVEVGFTVQKKAKATKSHFESVLPRRDDNKPICVCCKIVFYTLFVFDLSPSKCFTAPARRAVRLEAALAARARARAAGARKLTPERNYISHNMTASKTNSKERLFEGGKATFPTLDMSTWLALAFHHSRFRQFSSRVFQLLIKCTLRNGMSEI